MICRKYRLKTKVKCQRRLTAQLSEFSFASTRCNLPTDGTIIPTQGSHNTGYRMERYGPNESVLVVAGSGVVAATRAATSIAPMALPGDFILTHSSGFYGEVI